MASTILLLIMFGVLIVGAIVLAAVATLPSSSSSTSVSSTPKDHTYPYIDFNHFKALYEIAPDKWGLGGTTVIYFGREEREGFGRASNVSKNEDWLDYSSRYETKHLELDDKTSVKWIQKNKNITVEFVELKFEFTDEDLQRYTQWRQEMAYRKKEEGFNQQTSRAIRMWKDDIKRYEDKCKQDYEDALKQNEEALHNITLTLSS